MMPRCALRVTFALALLTIQVARAQDETPPAENLQPPNEAIRRLIQAATPGPGHRVLDGFVGSWTTVSRSWANGPDAAPAEAEGAADARWILDKRFLVIDAYPDRLSAKPTAMTMLGFDNVKAKFVSVYADTGSTAMFHSEGVPDRGGKTITFFGTVNDPATGERDRPVKYIWRVVSDDTLVYEFHDPVRNAKLGEVVYTRRRD